MYDLCQLPRVHARVLSRWHLLGVEPAVSIAVAPIPSMVCRKIRLTVATFCSEMGMYVVLSSDSSSQAGQGSSQFSVHP